MHYNLHFKCSLFLKLYKLDGVKLHSNYLLDELFYLTTIVLYDRYMVGSEPKLAKDGSQSPMLHAKFGNGPIFLVYRNQFNFETLESLRSSYIYYV